MKRKKKLKPNQIVAIGAAFALPILIWAMIAPYTTESVEEYVKCLGFATVGGVVLGLLAIQKSLQGKVNMAGVIAAVILVVILPLMVSWRSPPAPSRGTPTGAAGSALPAPPQVPTDAEVLTFLRENIVQLMVEDESGESKAALPWKLLPVATNPLVQPETIFPLQPYNPLRDETMLIPIDFSLYEGGQVTDRLITNRPTLIGSRSDRLPQYQGSIGKLKCYCHIAAEAGGLQLFPLNGEQYQNETVNVELSVKPRSDLHAVWLKTERINHSAEITPRERGGPLLMEWGKIPLSIKGKSLQRVVVQVEVRHENKAGALLTVNDLNDIQEMPVQPAFLIVGKSGKMKEVVFSTSGQERIATDEVGFTDEYCTVYIRLPDNRSLRWRISIRCDWPPGT